MSGPRPELTKEQWQRLNQLLEAALTLDDTAREHWLESLGSESPDVMAVLDELLAEQDTDSRGPLATGATMAQFMMAALPPADHPGDRVGPYRLLHVLGQGGMSTVWAAERADGTVQRQVALKIPHAEWTDRALSERLARECQVLADLNHPNIAHLYDAGSAANGRPWLALELVEGEPIDRRCASQGLDIHARVRLFIDVLKAVAYAHARLVVHRDIKPANVLVNPQGQVKLLDFGIAKMLGRDTGCAEETELTRLGGRPLTLAYAAPEQVTGSTITTATDLYALGAVLYELLCGVRPIQPRGESRSALEDAILNGRPALPSSVVSARAAARALQGDLDAILLKALARAPEARYATAEAFADDLRRYLDGRAVQARLASRRYRLERFLARNRLAVATAAAIAFALVSGLTVALWQAHEAAHQAVIAASERDRAVAALEYRDAVDAFLSDLLQEAGRAGKPVSIPELIDRAERLSAREFAGMPEARAAVLKTVADFKLNDEGVDPAIDDFEKALGLLKGSHNASLRASVGCSLAMLRGGAGKAGSLDEARRALNAIASSSETPSKVVIDCLGDLAQLELFDSNGPAAASASARALAAWNASSRKSPSQRAQLLTLASEAKAIEGDNDEAEAGFRQALAELERLGRDRGDWGERARFALIRCARETGNPLAALALIDESIRQFHIDMPGNRTPANMAEIRSAILAELGRYDEATASYRALAQEAEGNDPSMREHALLGAAFSASRAGHAMLAEDLYRDALKPAAGGQVEDGSYDQVNRLRTRATLDLDERHYDAARQALATALQVPGGALAMNAQLYRLRAEADLGGGHIPDALADALRGLGMERQLQGNRPSSSRTAQALLLLARAQAGQGDTTHARQSLAAAEAQLAGSLGAEHPWTRQVQVLAGSPLMRASTAMQLADDTHPKE